MPPYIDILHSEKVETVIDKKYEIKYGDFVMAMTGATIGKIGKLQIDSESKVYINQRVCKFIPEAFCDKEYLYYKLNTQEFQRFIYNNVDSKLAQPNIGHPTIYKYELELPLLSEQRRIGQFLKAIDDKINLNRAINHNLEALAKQLYDYWFVQFDFPNEEGKPYKSSGGKMIWNEKLKREIPEGWEVVKIQDIAQTYSGGTPTSTNRAYYDDGNIPWINSGELNSPIITSSSNYITEEGLNNSSAKLYPSNTVLVALYGATAGKVSLLSFEACSNQAICGVMPKEKFMTTYIQFYLSSLYEYFIILSSGSARDNISQDVIKNTYLSIPEYVLLKNYSDIVNPIINKIIAKKQEVEYLTKQHNELLPLLMNGQVSLNSD
ncbi:restriction endonuclease subunit S [Prevotella nanceiensis]|nr:restriction endonuclease subunit S [Hoylesella nanceiensis]